MDMSNIGFGNGMMPTLSAAGAPTTASGVAKTAAADASAVRDASVLTVTTGAASEIAEVSDAALTRDDPLGKLCERAFCLPAPQMPVFA